MDAIITVDNVTQSFGTQLVYRHVSFEVRSEEHTSELQSLV